MTIETWTPERVEKLQGFVVIGLSCSQIAAQIGVTRNAVIGKIHRLGLSPVRPPGASARSCPPRTRHRRMAGERRLLRVLFAEGTRAVEVAKAPGPVESAQPCSLLDLVNGQCRWPLGEAPGHFSAADFIFCGNETIAGLSYCAGHARLAYRASARRRT